MAKLFGNLKSTGLEAARDTVGGGGFIVESDVYGARINMAYHMTADSGAQGLVLSLQLNETGNEYRETLWLTNKQGDNFYYDKNDKTKKHALPGYQNANDLCLLTINPEDPVEIDDLDFEERIIKVWDFKEGKEVQKAMPVAHELLGKFVDVAIQKVRQNKQQKTDQGYVDTDQEQFVNNIVKFMHYEAKVTVTEAREGKEPTYREAWLDKNKGKTYDKYKAPAGKPGAPGGAGKSQSGGEKKSLFGKGV